MPRSRSAPDLYLLTKVSWLYHLRDQTQQQIADRLRISRPTVSRLLQEAKDLGIVQITVAPAQGMHTELEARLEEHFGLQEAVVVSSERRQSIDSVRHLIGSAAAAYLARTIEPGDSIGLAWGSTLSAMVQAMTRVPTEGVRVVQTLGGIGRPDAEEYAASLVRRLAQRLGATALPLAAPGIVASRAVRDALRDDPHVRATLEHLGKLDSIYVGVGSLASNPVLKDGSSFPPETYQELVAAGAIGDIAFHFFDAKGAPLRTSLDRRLLGITTEQLRATKRVVALAGGPDKLDAIFAALQDDIIDVLITDEVTAHALADRAA